MIALHRMMGIYLRFMYLVPRSIADFVDRFFFPTFDMIRFGFMSYWMQDLLQLKSDALTSEMLVVILCWHSLYFASMELTMLLLEEVSSRNLMNLYASPLRIQEWLSGVMLVSATKAVFTLSYGGLVGWVMYGINPLSVGWWLIPHLLLAVLCGWCIGVLGSTGVMMWGERAKSLSWATAWIFTPFMACFYPIKVLPLWAQKIGYYLPMTYLFENVRQLAATGDCNKQYLLIGFSLASAALVLLICSFFKAFKRNGAYGFDRLYN